MLSGGPNWELQANVLWGKQIFGNNLRVGEVGGEGGEGRVGVLTTWF